MTGGHLVFEVLASLRHETPSLVSSVRTLKGFPVPHNAQVVLQLKVSTG